MSQKCQKQTSETEILLERQFDGSNGSWQGNAKVKALPAVSNSRRFTRDLTTATHGRECEIRMCDGADAAQLGADIAARPGGGPALTLVIRRLSNAGPSQPQPAITIRGSPREATCP